MKNVEAQDQVKIVEVGRQKHIDAGRVVYNSIMIANMLNASCGEEFLRVCVGA